MPLLSGLKSNKGDFLGLKGKFVKNKNTPPAPLKRGARNGEKKESHLAHFNSPLERG
jgi:hypothetical protein